jgi:adenosylmethionine-8-amino-7-oxononanoate aminotransferase
MVLMAPPLVINAEQMDELLDILDQAVGDVEAELEIE